MPSCPELRERDHVPKKPRPRSQYPDDILPWDENRWSSTLELEGARVEIKVEDRHVVYSVNGAELDRAYLHVDVDAPECIAAFRRRVEASHARGNWPPAR